MDSSKSDSFKTQTNTKADSAKKISIANNINNKDPNICRIETLDLEHEAYERAYNHLYRSTLVACTMARYNEPYSEIYNYLRKAINDAESTLIFYLGMERYSQDDLSLLDMDELFGMDKN